MHDTLLRFFLECRQVTTDTRRLNPQAIFFALKGANFNGNDFVQQALDAGCPLVISDEEQTIRDPRLIRVQDSLQALQQLALDYRRTFTIPVLAITGSNGKTTTKELIRNVLAKKYQVHATAGNLNNHIGVALTILAMPLDTTFAVIEMGANHQKEIQSYCRFTEPTHGLITNIGKAHLEGFGGPEGVKMGKKELFDYLHDSGGVIFVNPELDHMQEITYGMKTVEFGLHCGGQDLDILEGHRTLHFQVGFDNQYRKEDVVTKLAGNYNIWNVAAALALGRYFGVPGDDILAAVEEYTPDSNRSQVMVSASNQLIMDAYNANPTSMEFALRNLADQKGSETFFIIGDMLELGGESLSEHRRILELARDLGLSGVCVGPIFQSLQAETAYQTFANAAAARAFLLANSQKGKLILLKGSRGIRLETIADAL